MKKLIFSAAVLSLCLTSCKKAEDKAVDAGPAADTTAAPAPETADAEAPVDSAAMEKAWMEYATPGEMHKLLASDVGSWNAKMTFYMGGKPSTENATAEVKPILRGRYFEQKYKGKMMGQDFEGVGTMGYNNASGKMFSTWFDNMGTGIMYISGDYDSASKSATMTGTMIDPMTKKDAKFREVYTWVDADTRKMEMFDTKSSGEEVKSMEIILTRK
ncbi:DUF1579 domain-containing protein [Flavobacterium selenitireducens]|uniref:DUF1579 domain-containing protein n=1 Tax=Flavobacterium selenitireducens TaxID=2722704 RepID=UPI00168A7E46|nr:DUF1579 domain-containing protein [Flavobacterium selenitireducens]MBD3582348.1 DUF1579 domain-containing protein [Flavobacterium selenitireducens]